MPSDFHPVLLVLGEARDLTAFGAILAGFAATAAPCRLAADGGVFSTDTEVALAAPGEEGAVRPGLWRDADDKGLLRWTLAPQTAAAFAAQVAALAAAQVPAGSVTLECALLGEIRVQVSLGEWEDGYLADATR